MMFQCVILARHGQTVWNQHRRREGQLNSPLTKQGMAQVAINAKIISTLSVDGIFTSPLVRAQTTARILAAPLGLNVIVIDELREVDHGFTAGMTSAEVNRKFPEETALRAEDRYHYRFPGGESYADVDARACIALAQIASEGVRLPLIVSHEMIGRMLFRNLLGLEPSAALNWNHPNHLMYWVDTMRGSVDELNAGRERQIECDDGFAIRS